MKKVLSLAWVSLVLGCGSPGSIVADPSPPAIAAGDFTALIRIEGCGYQPLVTEGYTYCRIPEGPIGNLAVTFIAPPQASNCKPAQCTPTPTQPCSPSPCVDFTLFFPDGSAPYQDSIPYGATSKTVPWSQMVKKANFSPDDTGFWLYTYTIRWIDSNGFAQKTVSDGEIRLRVIRSTVCDAKGANCQAYVPLRNAPDDPSFAWTWMEQDLRSESPLSRETQAIRMTTGARTYVSYPGSL